MDSTSILSVKPSQPECAKMLGVDSGERDTLNTYG